MARLEIDNVTAGYGDAVVLRNVSLVVPSGSVVVLLGPNGAGKTTLLSVVSGLMAPSIGTLRLDGESVAGLHPAELVKRGLCHIAEGRSIFPGLTVRENLRMFATKGSEDDLERAADAFPVLGQRLNQIAGTLSGGEQQMLALSRAYTRHAPLVLLDEVSMGLAPIVVGQIFEFLRVLAANGSTLLIVEQYVAKALAVADHVYVMSRGHIVFAGEPGEVAGSDVFARYLGDESSLVA